MQVALSKAQAKGFSGSGMKVTLQYTAGGDVTDASVASGSGDRDLDRAAISWARRVKLCPGSPGSGTLPIVFN